ncbi:unnamed protein product [Arabidopsis lyrata]|nr:unnamed protein product [Arabidopsis lyrata]
MEEISCLIGTSDTPPLFMTSGRSTAVISPSPQTRGDHSDKEKL